jgi:hypothetical protein
VAAAEKCNQEVLDNVSLPYDNLGQLGVNQVTGAVEFLNKLQVLSFSHNVLIQNDDQRKVP